MKRFRWVPAIISVMLLAGCVPSKKEDTKIVQETEEKAVETTIIPSNQVDESYYKTLIPYKESASRGLIVSNIYTKYDIKEVENGLMRLSQNQFDTENYYFQEGQYIPAETASAWLARGDQAEGGLNPVVPKGTSAEDRAKNYPVYLAHIVEQNYLKKTDDNKVGLAGVSIGLALNSIYYYQKEQYGEFYEQKISETELVKQGKAMAQEILSRLRANSALADVPIVIGLFKQNARNDIVPGTYFAYSVADKGKNSLGDWVDVDEEYVLFPTNEVEAAYRNVNDNFQNFKQDVDRYFSNYTSVVGTGFYKNKEIQKLTIEIPIQFYGTAEIIGFTQYVSGILLNHFPTDLSVEVSITSTNGPEALIIKKRNDEEPFVHIYD